MASDNIIDGGAKPSVLWQMIPYLVITCSEVMVSITGLDFAYTQAPKAMKPYAAKRRMTIFVLPILLILS